MINDVLVLQRNIVVAANYAKIQPHGTELTWPAMRLRPSRALHDRHGHRGRLGLARGVLQ